jgi:hypothetical protein
MVGIISSPPKGREVEKPKTSEGHRRKFPGKALETGVIQN